MLGALALLFVHLAFFVIPKLPLWVFFFLFKLFLPFLSCFYWFVAFVLHFVLCWFLSLSEVPLGWRWKCYRWVVVVAVVGSSSEVHQVRELCCCLSELIRMFNFNIRIKLIHNVYKNQVDSYKSYGSTWSVWYTNFEICKNCLKFYFILIIHMFVCKFVKKNYFFICVFEIIRM